MKNPIWCVAPAALALLSLAGCAPPAATGDVAAADPVAASTQDAKRDIALRAPPGIVVPASRTASDVVVHKSPTCGCCSAWVEHLRSEGFSVEVRDSDDLEPLKARLGVPVAQRSCHTAEVGGYFVEGHVPAGDIKRLLAERPAARGLAVPGMPLGSPGMEVPGGHIEPYDVELVSRDGATRPYARHGEPGS